MKIPIVLDIDIDVAAWAKAIDFRIEGGLVVSDEGQFSIEDFEENIRMRLNRNSLKKASSIILKMR